MTKFNLINLLAGAATGAALSIALSGSAFAQSGGIGGHTGPVGPVNTTNFTQSSKATNTGSRDHHRFLSYGYGYVNSGPACYYSPDKLTIDAILSSVGEDYALTFSEASS